MVSITYVAPWIFEVNTQRRTAYYTNINREMPLLWFVWLFLYTFVCIRYLLHAHTAHSHVSIHSQYWTNANTINHDPMSSMHWFLWNAFDIINGFTSFFFAVRHQQLFLSSRSLRKMAGGEKKNTVNHKIISWLIWVFVIAWKRYAFISMLRKGILNRINSGLGTGFLLSKFSPNPTIFVLFDCFKCRSVAFYKGLMSFINRKPVLNKSSFSTLCWKKLWIIIWPHAV